MKTHFKKFRRTLLLRAIFAPLSVYIAFLLFAAGFTLLYLIPLFVWLFFNPNWIEGEQFNDESEEAWKPRLRYLVNMIFSILLILWLFSLPEVKLLIDRIFETKALWDWRLITAGGICCAHQIVINYFEMKKLSDHDILTMYDETE